MTQSTNKTVPGTSATLKGGKLSELSVLRKLQDITYGTMNIDVNLITIRLEGLEFSTAVTLIEVAAILDAVIPGATVTSEDLSILITSDLTGLSSILSFARDSFTGDFIGDILKITAGSGAVLTQGRVLNK